MANLATRAHTTASRGTSKARQVYGVVRHKASETAMATREKARKAYGAVRHAAHNPGAAAAEVRALVREKRAQDTLGGIAARSYDKGIAGFVQGGMDGTPAGAWFRQTTRNLMELSTAIGVLGAVVRLGDWDKKAGPFRAANTAYIEAKVPVITYQLGHNFWPWLEKHVTGSTTKGVAGIEGAGAPAKPACAAEMVPGEATVS